MLANVERVDHQQADSRADAEKIRSGRQERRCDGHPVRDEEVAHVLAQDVRLDEHQVAGGSPPSLDHDCDAGNEHGQRREHERRPQDRPDADPVSVRGGTRLAGQEDRHDRDERLGQCRADGGEDAAHGTLGQVELAAEPLDPVGEELGAHEDHHEGDEQQEEVHVSARAGTDPPGPAAWVRIRW